MPSSNDLFITFIDGANQSLSAIKKDVSDINVTLAEQAAVLREHVRRTQLLEEATKPIIDKYNDKLVFMRQAKVYLSYAKYLKWPAALLALYNGVPDSTIKFILGLF
jgi:hypothetical protein